MRIHDYLTTIRAPHDFVSWSKFLGSNYEEAYSICPRADWLLYFIAPVIRREQLVKIACACARTPLKHVPKYELRPLQARRTEDKATIEEVRAAANAACACAYATADAVYATSRYDADATSYAAYHAGNAGNAGNAGAYYAAYYAAYAAYYAAARCVSQKEICQLTRDMLPFERSRLPKREAEGEYL